MNSKSRSCAKHEIPEALKSDHEMLRDELLRAATEPGRIGRAAKRVAQLCLPHFAEEEEHVFAAIGLLQDLGSDRVPSEIIRFIAQWSVRHLAMGEHGNAINVAIKELMQEATEAGNKTIAELVNKLRNHEKIEIQVMYPTLLFADASVRDRLGN